MKVHFILLVTIGKRFSLLQTMENIQFGLVIIVSFGNIYIRFGDKLYRKTVGIPMGTNCAPLVYDLFLFYYERDFMTSLSNDNQAGIIEAFNSTSRYLDDILNNDNPHRV